MLCEGLFCALLAFCLYSVTYHMQHMDEALQTIVDIANDVRYRLCIADAYSHHQHDDYHAAIDNNNNHRRRRATINTTSSSIQQTTAVVRVGALPAD